VVFGVVTLVATAARDPAGALAATIRRCHQLVRGRLLIAAVERAETQVAQECVEICTESFTIKPVIRVDAIAG
jgi:hypothetical protein